ncbi:hypothetical protein roselon_02968 [Roseibacterium elongatum DSM 19469]|uniref:Uncharacterized protein n=1 Tax=Roseicyclus elongatus DSM 19469 TaxID=1294273 RepID=W8RVE1_9RHOB|nr:hypothetical protein roselon_02968 [Roseibacterium elongatum DSM 19469]
MGNGPDRGPVCGKLRRQLRFFDHALARKVTLAGSRCAIIGAESTRLADGSQLALSPAPALP